MENGKTHLKIIQDDPWLTPHEEYLEKRLEWYNKHIRFIDQSCNGLRLFASGHKYFGFNYDTEKKGWWFRKPYRGFQLVGHKCRPAIPITGRDMGDFPPR